ncbi:XRE family transcriptional regulator [Streptomyces kunmingensis]|uniref:XRE family transcriptional regulator n=1 Tax=Streptomyces kunmingensis TaxID=68225 RepID=A0ABU6CPU6_9ACTN|nr:XRE family transcriptional regulator [Streptomyces kunmingensis]MEB3966454.1 XRE family transcriptional regulator [Streptomyces kunmingensis]
MPRWRALPDELDPEVKEFASQLRRLVDRSGLGIAALADRTGYSKTSWERYLNGRLLAPKGAIVALAEVTGTNPVHLTTMWELAERAWSRSEMRHDMTMEAIRISQARAALGEFGGPTAPAGSRGDGGRGSGGGGGRNGSATASRVAGVAGAAGPAGVPPTVPPQASAPRADQFGPAGPVGPVAPPAAPPGGSGSGGKRRLTMFLAGVVGAAIVVLVAYVLTSGGDKGKNENAGPSSSPTSSAPQLPAGVQCVGAGCTGKDPEAMGCGGDLADSPTRAVVGAVTVEVRYSKTCKAAWARIQGATPGDSVQLRSSAESSKKGLVGDADTDAYTPMVAVGSASDAKACATLASGQNGCTE